MGFKQELSIIMTDCCDTIELCDVTCEPSVCNLTPCLEGYGVDGNPNKWDVTSTDFNITFPDGNILAGLNFGYLPNNRAVGWAEITTGTNGDVSIALSGYGQIGTAAFNTNLPTTVTDLIISINSNAHITGFRAYVDSTNSQKVFFFNITDGAGANGAPIFLGVNGDMGGTTSTTIEGGTDEPACLTVTLSEIWALAGGTVLNNNPGPSFADGVYKFDYITYGVDPSGGADPIELGRVSETVLFDCNVVSCLKEALINGEGCGCSAEYDERILRTRLKIEQARHQFTECLFDCAQESILKAGRMCSDVCIDC